VASVQNVLVAWPLAFLVGVVVGLVLCGRGYRIVRTHKEES
jgi:hypothetical protein